DGLKTSTSPQSSCIYNDPGTYYLWTTVTDNQGLMDAAKTYITVLPGSSSPPPPPPPPPPDTTPPTLSITAPANGATVSGSVTVTASAGDNVGVTAVTISVDGTALCVDNTSPYSCSWDTTKATNASHTISATATDAASNARTAPVISVTVSNLPDPRAWFNAPVPNSNLSPVTITGQYTVQVGASDNVSLSLIELFIDSTNNRVASTSVSSTSGTLTYKWNTTHKSQKGNHTLIARATDVAGKSSSQTVSVMVK